jgi:hypothetical protein
MIFPTMRTLHWLAGFRAGVDAGTRGLCRRRSRCGLLPAGRLRRRSTAALHGARSAVRRTRAGVPRRPARTRAGLAARAAGAPVAAPASPHRPQCQRHDRPRHQQLHRGRARPAATSSSTRALADLEHVERLLAFTAGKITAILSAPIRTPTTRTGGTAAGPACALLTGHTPPVLGLASAATARAQIRCSCPTAPSATASVCIWTTASTHHPARHAHPGPRRQPPVPGLEEDGLLFSGDHILNGSTTIIDPPDGEHERLPRFAGRAERRLRQRCHPNSSCRRMAT